MTSFTDLPDLMAAYTAAEQQIQVLECFLGDLKQRKDQAETAHQLPEFGYLQFKLGLMEDMKKMYEEYRDSCWISLQQESSAVLQDILQTDGSDPAHTAVPYSPLLPSAGLLTPPITPLRDTAEQRRIPHQTGDMDRHIRNLMDEISAHGRDA